MSSELEAGKVAKIPWIMIDLNEPCGPKIGSIVTSKESPFNFRALKYGKVKLILFNVSNYRNYSLVSISKFLHCSKFLSGIPSQNCRDVMNPSHKKIRSRLS